MADDLQSFVDLLPATGVIPFDEWKQSIVASNGRPLSNRQFNALRKRSIQMSTNAEGVLVVGRKPEGGA